MRFASGRWWLWVLISLAVTVAGVLVIWPSWGVLPVLFVLPPIIVMRRSNEGGDDNERQFPDDAGHWP
ncbi:MAG: hypothetical protein D6806_08565 [Deltaproteobacteria bacterium]|nr:MAG: hypothetical protein D6806_08565 [Deltaproteobacteria bacterium]